MDIEQFRLFIHKVLVDDLKVDTVTIYMPDFWTRGKKYRLLCMDGVEDHAPMYGPAHPKKAEERLLANPIPVWFVPEVAKSGLFKKGSFTDREGIKSLARFYLLTASPCSMERPGAILFVGYRNPQLFEADYAGRLTTAVSAIEAILQQLGGTPFMNDQTLVQQIGWLAQIAEATRDIADKPGVDAVIEYVLQSALEITEVGKNGYCCIHLMQPDRKHIRCEYRMWEGKFDNTPSSNVEVETGAGITTRVARDERPLLLHDIADSCGRFPNRYRYSVHAGASIGEMRSELAVPMYAQEERLIGVLNIESPDKGAFNSEHVRVMERLADNAAIAINERSFSERLNQIVKATSEIDPAQNLKEVVKAIRTQAAEQLNAHYSDFWRYRDGNFSNPVDPDAEGRPRSQAQDQKEGISEWLLTKGQRLEPPVKAVLLEEMNHVNGSCNLRTVSEVGDELKMQPAGVEIKLNPRMDQRTLSEAGLPLVFKKEPLGALWVKWRSSHEFTNGELPLLERFADQVTLAFRLADILQEPINEAYRRIFRSVFGEDRASYFASRSHLLEPALLPQVTVMFADIRASTEILSILHRNQNQSYFVDMIRNFLKKATEIVHSHGGALATFLGDGIMAIFGAALTEQEKPDTEFHAEHAEHAALAAIELADYFRDNFKDWKQNIILKSGGATFPKNFGLGVGLTMDSALVGNFAEEGGFHFTAVGRAPTIASRIEGKARCEGLKALWPSGVEPDTIIVLSTIFMKEHFPKESLITFSPLNEPVELDGLDGKFDLAVLHRS